MTEWHDRKQAAEKVALTAMEHLADACVELRTAVAEDAEIKDSTLAKLDVQRRLVWCQIRDAIGYAEGRLGWDLEPQDLLYVHSKATQGLYAEYHDRGVALSAGKPVVAARNKMLRAARAAELALEDLGVIYDEHLSSPKLYPAATEPLDRMKELHEAVAGPLPRKAGPSQPRRRSMSQRLTSRMRAGRPLRS